MGKRRAPSWTAVALVWTAAAAASWFAYQRWQHHQYHAPVVIQHVKPPATPNARVDMRNDHLVPGEICLDGVYMRRQPDGSFSTARAQDWKCIEQAQRRR